MISQNVWIGITIGIFFVGLGIGFAAFSNSNQSMNVFQNQNMFNQMMGQNPQAMTWMMDDPQIRQQMFQQMFQQMMQDPEQMSEWMANDPKHIEQMSEIMKENHVFMSKMMSTVMNDPDLRLQMVGHMSENPEAFKEMMSMMGSRVQENLMMNQDAEQMTDGNMTGMKDSGMAGNMMTHP